MVFLAGIQVVVCGRTSMSATMAEELFEDGEGLSHEEKEVRGLGWWLEVITTNRALIS